MKRTTLTVFSFILSLSVLFADDFFTATDGDFSDPSTWQSVAVPTNEDQIYINHNVTYSGDIDLINDAELHISEGASFTLEDLNFYNFTLMEVHGHLSVNDLYTGFFAEMNIGPNGIVNISNNWTNWSYSEGIDGTMNIGGVFRNILFGELIGEGKITADEYTGWGITFGHINGEIDGGTTVHGDGTLPIELLSFEANGNNNQAVIEWTTASEMNNDYFTIERSSDGINYKPIATVNGAGTSNSVNSYSYTDNTPGYGTLYYRLSQTDYDGRNETFAPVSLEIEEEKDMLLTAQANTLNISTSDLPYNLYVYSISGKCVFSGQNISDNYKQLNLETGFYIVNIDQQTSHKIYIP